MGPYVRLAIVVLVLASSVHAQEAAAPRAAGRVLVLDNERLLEGEVERHGDQFCLHQASGELWLPADKVLKVCAGREEAFAFIAARANLRDPDERLRLARWCQVNGLYEQAVREATAAVQLRPDSPEARHLLDSVRRAAATQNTTPAAKPKPAAPPEDMAPVDVSLESLSAFTIKVQPILMNTCVRCHANGRGGHFILRRTYEGGPLDHRTTQQNLTAVLAQINFQQPELSPLLIKATSAHGNQAEPPIRGKATMPYQLLANWVAFTLATNPQLLQHPPAEKAQPIREAAPPTTPPPPVVEYRPASSASRHSAAVQPGPVVVSAPEPTPPTRSDTCPPDSSDPYDPQAFNRLSSRH
jgi:hypothetical protein